jgi:sodium-dependent dicarboxylate transporter 2/3/5
MAAWWISEALPLAATALVPLVAFPVLGIDSLEGAARSYAHPLIFLFLGGFLIAAAMERWTLHRRLALFVVRLGGNSARALVLSLMVATAFLSMWVSNTATAIVMVPIARSLIAAHTVDGVLDPAAGPGFAPAMMLGIAFSATIGGMGTLIGTPPNALFAGFMETTYGVEIDFARWMLVGVPVVAALLPVTWLMLTRVSFAVAAGPLAAQYAHEEALAPMAGPEKLLAAVVVLTAVALVLRPLIAGALPGLPLSDAGIVMSGALVLFAMPANWAAGTRLLEWRDAKALRWDVLILFGGGLALASAIDASGLAAWIGAGFAALEALPMALLVLIAMVVIVYLGEIGSNTAMAAVFLPIAGAAAVGLGAAPLALALPVAMAASLGFMLPVATPPNAIVYGSGAVTSRQMLHAGALLDVIAVLIVYALAMTLAPAVFAIDGVM